jgi:uncharacterized protein (TIGR02677 family)
MYQEEVYQELTQESYFSEYTMEQCQQDLANLVTWGNLTTIQDTRKVATLEEFKNKKFRYQLSEYTVEIERMVIRLENLSIEGASLEPSLLERIRLHFVKMKELEIETDERLYAWWSDLNNDFVRLNQNYQDYMRTLNSVKAEELMKTREFLVFKDHLVEYLRSFVKSLQLNVTVIEQMLGEMDEQKVLPLLRRIRDYELTIPRMDAEINEQQIWEKIQGRWENISKWFLGENGMDSEAGKVFDTTNEIIRKITRYATRISELANSGANRREEYRKLAQVFAKCRDLNEAHKLSACVFGIEKPLHLRAAIQRQTESMNSGVYEEEPFVVTVQPRIRAFREKAHRSSIIDRSSEKEKTRQEVMIRREKERRLLQSYIVDGKLEFSKLPVLEPQIRDTFLMWLSKALERKDRRAKTEEGREYFIREKEGETCILHCTDGEFTMPAYTLVFLEEENGDSYVGVGNFVK